MVIRAADAADEAAADIRKRSQTLVDSMISRSNQFKGGAGSAFRKVLVEFADDLNVHVLQRLETLSGNTRTAASSLFSQDEVNAAEITAKGNNFGGGTMGDSGGHASGPSASAPHSSPVTAALS